MDNEMLSGFVNAAKKSKSTVFFGGAGVSTESGLKDYRSKDGLYTTVKQYGVSPETILSHSFFCNNTATFYDFYYNFFLNVSAAPGRAHMALAALEKAGRLSAVITQNIDGLHQKAGSENVLELHGSILRNRCTHCGEFYGADFLKSFAGKVPMCKKCGAVVKPEVVLYEEPLDEEVTDKAISAISNADLLIIGGTSLAVYPAAGFLSYFKGDSIVLINKGATGFDSRADFVFRDSIGDVLCACTREVLNNE